MSLVDWYRKKKTEIRQNRVRQHRIREGVEQLVDLIDPRLRAVSGYRKRLAPAVVNAVASLDELINSMPPATTLSRKAWAGNHYFRAYFVNPDHMQEVLDSSPVLNRFLSSGAALDANEIYAVLSMRLDRKTRFGTEMVNDNLVADRPQTAVSFTDHRIGAPNTGGANFREALYRRAFEELAAIASQRLIDKQTRTGSLNEQQNRLKWKIRTYEMRKAGLGSLSHDEGDYQHHIDELNAQLGEVNDELKGLLKNAGNFEQLLEQVVSEFESVGDIIRLRPLSVSLNNMHIEADSSSGGHRLDLIELTVDKQEPRIVHMIKFSPDLPSGNSGETFRKAAKALGVS